jgi:hypothetical protein
MFKYGMDFTLLTPELFSSLQRLIKRINQEISNEQKDTL